MVRRIAPGETVRILVNGAAHEAAARRALAAARVPRRGVEFLRWPTHRAWTRDFGPMFVKTPDPETVSIVRFRFNAWARYSDWRKDDAVPVRAARRLNLPLLPVRHRRRAVVLEGGALDVNGRGTLLTTEECLLHPRVQVRNPGFRRADYEAVFRDALGAANVLWLGRGIAGDDTHGHVDDVCRFAGPRTIVLCREKNPRDANYRALEENRERVRGFRLEDGSRPEAVSLPMPAPVVHRGRRLPASYANFYIANAAVLVPVFGDPNDRVALGVLGDLFRDRPVAAIPARDLVVGRGTVHCLTQQEPMDDALDAEAILVEARRLRASVKGRP
jgi:agmatine deiminase